MNILLYSPSYYARPVTMNFPYAIVALGSYLDEKGYSVRLLDGSVEVDIVRKIRENALWADIMGVSMTTFQINYALRDIAVAKKVNPKISVVAGGVHPTLMPEEAISHPDIDFVITHEGEGPLKELIDAIDLGREVDGIPNVVYKKGGTIIKNEPRPFLDMNSLPSMDWELLQNKTLKEMRERKTGVLLAGKGCNYRCTFCFNPVARNTFRGRSAENIIKDIELLRQRYDIQDVYFRDENFLCFKERALTVAEYITSHNLDITWSVLSRVNFLGKRSITDRDLAALVKSGLRKIKFGAESDDQHMLDELKKGITVDQIYEAARMCERHNVKGSFSFMTGLPGETWDQYMKTLDVIDTVKGILGKNAEILGPHAFFVYPAGQLYKKCIRLGYEAPQTLEEWGNFKRHAVTGLSQYYRQDHRHYHYIQNIALIRALRDVSLAALVKPPYRLKDLRNITLLPVIAMAKIRWRFRWFGAGLIEMRIIAYLKGIFFGQQGRTDERLDFKKGAEQYEKSIAMCSSV